MTRCSGFTCIYNLLFAWCLQACIFKLPINGTGHGALAISLLAEPTQYNFFTAAFRVLPGGLRALALKSETGEVYVQTLQTGRRTLLMNRSDYGGGNGTSVTGVRLVITTSGEAWVLVLRISVPQARFPCTRVLSLRTSMLLLLDERWIADQCVTGISPCTLTMLRAAVGTRCVLALRWRWDWGPLLPVRHFGYCSTCSSRWHAGACSCCQWRQQRWWRCISAGSSNSDTNTGRSYSRRSSSTAGLLALSPVIQSNFIPISVCFRRASSRS